MIGVGSRRSAHAAYRLLSITCPYIFLLYLCSFSRLVFSQLEKVSKADEELSHRNFQYMIFAFLATFIFDFLYKKRIRRRQICVAQQSGCATAQMCNRRRAVCSECTSLLSLVKRLINGCLLNFHFYLLSRLSALIGMEYLYNR